MVVLHSPINYGKIKPNKEESVIFRRDNSHYEKRGKTERCINDEIPFDLPENWIWVRLGEILLKLTDGTHVTPKYAISGIPFLSVKNISSGVICFDDAKYISKEDHNELYKHCDPQKGDVLLTKVGTTGIPVLIDTDKKFSLFVSVALLKFNQRLISNKFLVLLLQSPLVREQCNRDTKGVGNQNWVIRDIANTIIPFPPLVEQHRILAQIDTLFAVCDRL